MCVCVCVRLFISVFTEWRAELNESPRPLCVCLSRRETASPCGDLSRGGKLTQSHRLDPRCCTTTTTTTMLTRVKSAVANFMGGMMAGGSNGDHPGSSDLPLRFPYSRPEFLGLSPDEIECSADHIARPILILKETKRLPWSTGYAEWVNLYASIFSCRERRASFGEVSASFLDRGVNTSTRRLYYCFYYYRYHCYYGRLHVDIIIIRPMCCRLSFPIIFLYRPRPQDIYTPLSNR